MNKAQGFTLLELIVVIVILGILATLGFTQYNKQVESTRLAEAKTMIGSMRQLVHQYWLEHGDLSTITNSDVGANNTCASTNFYKYSIPNKLTTYLELAASRCTSNGKTPNVSRQYIYYLVYNPGEGINVWHCYYSDDNSSCFGLPP